MNTLLQNIKSRDREGAGYKNLTEIVPFFDRISFLVG